MTIEIIVAICGTAIAAFGLIMKNIAEMKREVAATTATFVRSEGQLQMINYRLDNVEKTVNKLDNGIDDISRYMANNSDWTNRKH